MKADPDYRFDPLRESDLPLIGRWLDAQHVKRWWRTPDGLAEIRELVESEQGEAFLVFWRDRPIGYLQYYLPEREPGHPYGDMPAGTFGIDQFIGEADMTGQGHGPASLTAFCAMLEDMGASLFLIDPEPDNAIAIRSYEKAGFRHHEDRIVYGERQRLMLRRPNKRQDENDPFFPA